MGGPKALLPRGEVPLLAEVLRAWIGLRTMVVAVVDARDLAALLPALPPSAHLLCADGEAAMIHSVRAGLAAAALLGAERIFLQPVDAGAPTAAVVAGLRAALPGPWAVKPVAEGRGGHPLLLTAQALAAMPWRTASDLRRAVAALPAERVRRLPVRDASVLRNWNRPDHLDPEP